jgi:hypothetical protein
MADGQFDLLPLLSLLRASQAVSANPEPQPDLPDGQYSSDQASRWMAWHGAKLQSFQSLANPGGAPTPTPGPTIPTDIPNGPTIPTDYTGTPQGPNPHNIIGQPQPGPTIPTDFPQPPPLTPGPAVPDIAKMGPPPVASPSPPTPAATIPFSPARPPTSAPLSNGTLTNQTSAPGLPSSSRGGAGAFGASR